MSVIKLLVVALITCEIHYLFGPVNKVLTSVYIQHTKSDNINHRFNDKTLGTLPNTQYVAMWRKHDSHSLYGRFTWSAELNVYSTVCEIISGLTTFLSSYWNETYIMTCSH